jgi:hypothetical protein
MKAEFHPEDDPDGVVATAVWDGAGVGFDTEDPTIHDALLRVYRKTPVVTDDASYRRQGTHGEVVIQPGDLEWFRAASLVRGPKESGLRVRLVPGITEGGFDPAAGYRSFGATFERLDSRAADVR